MLKKRAIGVTGALLLALHAMHPVLTIKANDTPQLSTAYTGDEILEYAKATYDDWGYQEIDTCTGFASHVYHHDLQVPVANSIIGWRVWVGLYQEPYNGYLTRYAPDAMIANAEAMVAQGKAIKVFAGDCRDAYNSPIPIRNGDIVLASRYDIGGAYGHVAMAEVREDGTTGWFGAHNDSVPLPQQVSYMPFARNAEDNEYTTGKAEDYPTFYHGNVYIYRTTDYEKPQYEDNIETTKEVTYSVGIKREEEPIKGAKYTFKMEDDKQTIMTDSQGIARYSRTKTFEVSKEQYKYITNYDKLSKEDKAQIDKNKVFKSYEEAQAQADHDLMEKALANPVDFKNCTITEDETENVYTTESKEVFIEDARMAKQNVKIVGFSLGAKCAVYNSENELVEEFMTEDIGHNTVGYIVKNLEENGTYRVVEQQEPEGYVRSEDVTFTVGAGNNVVYLQEKPIMGTLKINTTANVLKKFENGEPVYEKEAVKGTHYTVYAKEDIKSGTKIVYTYGQEIGTFEDEMPDLPVGHYYFTIGSAPAGYVADGIKYNFAVENGNITDPVYEYDVVLKDQKVMLDVSDFKDANEITVYRKGSNTKIYTSKIDHEGIVIASKTTNLPVGEYYLTINSDKKQYPFKIGGTTSIVESYTKKIMVDAKEAKTEAKKESATIKVRLTDSQEIDKGIDGSEFVIAKDESFEKVEQTVKTNKEGTATFTNLPYGSYYIKQTTKTGNYSLQDKTYYVNLNNESKDVMVNVTNKKTEASISSKDLGGILTVAGLEAEVKNSKGKVIDQWETGKMTHIVEGLEEGETYTLSVVNSIEGYEQPASVDFVMKDGMSLTLKSRPVETLMESLTESAYLSTWQVLSIGIGGLLISVLEHQKGWLKSLFKGRKVK